MEMEREEDRRERPSLRRRRSLGQNLVPLQIPSHHTSPSVLPVVRDLDLRIRLGGEDEEQVEEEGQELFENFLYEEIQRCPSARSQESSPNTPPSYKNPVWAKAGRDLRVMADKFARTEERRRVRERAVQLGIDATEEQFHDLLSQMFSRGGVTRERIVVLFYFCSDVAIQALLVGKNLFTQFLTWSLNFIREKICTWVYRNGGWGRVLSSPFNSLVKLTAWAAVAVLALVVFRYLKR